MIPIESQPPPPIVAPVPEGVQRVFNELVGERVPVERQNHRSGPRAPRDTSHNRGERSPSSFEKRRGQRRPRSSIARESGSINNPSSPLGSTGLVFEEETPTAHPRDGVLLPKEWQTFERAVGLNGNTGEVNQHDLKEVAQLNQHALKRIGFGRLGRDLRDGHLVGEARRAARAFVEGVAQFTDAGAEEQDEEVIKTVIDGLKEKFPDEWQLVGTGAALAGAAMLLKKRGRQGLAYLMLMGGLAFCGGGSATKSPENPHALDAFVHTEGFGIQQTYLDNAAVSASEFGQLYGVSPDVAPNYATLTTTLLRNLTRDYPQLSPTTLSYVNLKDTRSARALEFAIVGTNQTAATGEPLFVVAYLDNGKVRITTVVQKGNDHYQVTYSDGSSREEVVTSYRLVEGVDESGNLLLGDPLEVIIPGETPYVIVIDPRADGDAFVFTPLAETQDKTILVGSAGRFGPRFDALKPVEGIPPTEAAPEPPQPASATPEQLPSATPLPSETPEPSATPDRVASFEIPTNHAPFLVFEGGVSKTLTTQVGKNFAFYFTRFQPYLVDYQKTSMAGVDVVTATAIFETPEGDKRSVQLIFEPKYIKYVDFANHKGLRGIENEDIPIDALIQDIQGWIQQKNQLTMRVIIGYGGIPPEVKGRDCFESCSAVDDILLEIDPKELIQFYKSRGATSGSAVQLVVSSVGFGDEDILLTNADEAFFNWPVEQIDQYPFHPNP